MIGFEQRGQRLTEGYGQNFRFFIQVKDPHVPIWKHAGADAIHRVQAKHVLMPLIAKNTLVIELVDNGSLPFKCLKKHIAETNQNTGDSVFVIVSNCGYTDGVNIALGEGAGKSANVE